MPGGVTPGFDMHLVIVRTLTLETKLATAKYIFKFSVPAKSGNGRISIITKTVLRNTEAMSYRIHIALKVGVHIRKAGHR